MVLKTLILQFHGSTVVRQYTLLLADHENIENSSKPCDIGSSIPDLEQEFPQLDFSHVDKLYPDKTSPAACRYAYTRSAILDRAQIALKSLYHRPEEAILVVSHSAFMKHAVTGAHFANADYRIFEFAKHDRQLEGFALLEWEITKESRGGRGKSLEGVPAIGSVDLPPDPDTETRELDSEDI